jgi:3-oxoacyl-[acyl-carrier protein] reductase
MGIFDGKVSVVSGASSGIGRATAQLLAAHGSALVLPYSAAADGGSALAEAAAAAIERESGAAIELIEADVSSREAIVRAFEAGERRFGRLDHVVHCAAIIAIKPFLEISEADYDRMFAVNTRGSFFVLQEAARRVRDGGRIVAFSSPASRQAGPGGALYSGTKSPIESFVRTLAWELGPRSITVNAISPGITDTPMLLPYWRERGPAMSPFNRLGTPRDVAESVYLLLQREAAWLTGQTIFAGGGVMMG